MSPLPRGSGLKYVSKLDILIRHNFIDLFGSLTTSIFREKLSLEFRVSDYKLKDSM